MGVDRRWETGVFIITFHLDAFTAKRLFFSQRAVRATSRLNKCVKIVSFGAACLTGDPLTCFICSRSPQRKASQLRQSLSNRTHHPWCEFVTQEGSSRVKWPIAENKMTECGKKDPLTDSQWSVININRSVTGERNCTLKETYRVTSAGIIVDTSKLSSD